jgi:membrane-bound serine protease (ClpP class)
MRRVVLLPLLLTSALLFAPPAQGRGRAQGEREAIVDVVKVQGVIDPSLADYVRGAIEAAEGDGAAVVLQIDSRGSFREEARSLAAAIRSAAVPVVSWIGPSGARAAGGSLFVVYACSFVAMAPGAGIGPARPFDLGVDTPAEDRASAGRLAAELVGLAEGAGAAPDAVRQLVEGPALPAGPALDAGAVSLVAVDLPDLLQQLDGQSVMTSRGLATLSTLSRPDRPVLIRFHEIGLARRVLHAVSTPTAVYVLLVLGLWGIAFELTQSGIGIAGISGVVSLALAGYGLAVVPIHWLGLGLLVAGIGLMALDVLIHRVGVITLAGTALFAAGSVLAWRGVAAAIDLSLWLIVLFTLAGALYFGFGLTVALKARERVRTAQVGLVGLVGEVRTDLNPEGGVFVKGALWRARTTDGDIPKGARVRVRGIDGLILRVEQEPD